MTELTELNALREKQEIRSEITSSLRYPGSPPGEGGV